MQVYFQSKIGRKNNNIQPGPEKQNSYKKECRPLVPGAWSK